MNVLTLARWQFGITTVYHFFFVPLTLGLSLLLALMETQFVRTGDPVYKRMTQFWGRLFLINFAMGVATGIVQEFQFGMNWSEYSRFVGDMFGAPLAVEALVAFFLESTFLGVWVFGWDKLSPRVHALMIWLVAIGSNLSAFWILVANSWMQEPVGYVLRNGRAEMESFLALLTNPHVPFMFGHVLTGGLATAGFFVVGICAWHLRRGAGKEQAFFAKSFRLGALFALIGSLAVAVIGHLQGQHLVHAQPMKLAAAEALWETEDPAGLSLVATIDEQNQRTPFAIRIPAALSFLAYNRPSGPIRGMKELQAECVRKHGPGDYIPPVAVTFWSFRVMVLAGVVMIGLALPAFLKTRGGRTPAFRPWLYGALVLAIGLPYVANSAGWIMTELGRQPWIVYGVMLTAQGVSLATRAGAVLFTVAGFTLVYGLLMVVDVYLLRKYSVLGPVAGETH